ncbi:MAG: hypothetical protein Q8P49_01440 [Candidatus Liptonbacteria bacterium]|nr:hypothetical protein [Candidatus Liptonbacteria bacterium]
MRSKYQREKRLRREKVQRETDKLIRGLDALKRRGKISSAEFERHRANILEQERVKLGGRRKWKKVKLVSAVRTRSTLDPVRNNGGRWIQIVPGGLPELGKR